MMVKHKRGWEGEYVSMAAGGFVLVRHAGRIKSWRVEKTDKLAAYQRAFPQYKPKKENGTASLTH